MKKIMSKNLTQKIIIAIVMVLSFNFVAPNFSQASFGGTLFGPLIDVFTSFLDGVMALIQVCVDSNENINFKIMSFTAFMIESDDFDGNQKKYGMDVDSASGKNISNLEIDAKDLDHGWFGMGTYTIPIIQYGPDKIFSNEVPALDANFINPKDWNDDDKNDKSIASQLQATISSWYNALRNLVIVGLLSILVYVGIRMMITSVASDKAKYKQMFMDWLIALCLVFFLHYIMNFTMTVTQMITDGLKGATNVKVTINDSDAKNGKIEYVTNLTGAVRMQVEYSDLLKRVMYALLYLGLVLYTIKFTWEYIKRVITMAFLTLMAPLVTLTYPIDKMGDGKAQAFNMWLKEYVFNALLQPFHLIIYAIFIGSAENLIIDNPLYAILVFAFMGPAEKILRKFFGFDKASTASGGFIGGFGGAAAFNAVKGVVSRGAQRLGNGGSGGSSGSKPIRQQASLDKPVKSDDAPSGYGAFATANANADNNNNPQANNNPRNGTDIPGEINGGNGSRVLPGYDESGNPLNPELNTPQPEQGTENNNPGLLRRGLNATGNAVKNAGLGAGRYIKGAAKSAGSYVGSGLKHRFMTREGWADTGKRLGKAAIRATTTGVGAAVGLGMGIAGDNLEDVFKYGAAGAALGATALNNMVLGAGSRVANSGIVQAASQGGREAYYGSVNAAKTEAQDRQLKEAGDIRQSIGGEIVHDDGTRLSNKELNDYEERGISHYDAGITDLGDINKTLKLEDSIRSDLASNTQMNEEERNQTAKLQSQTIAKIAGDVKGDKLATDAKYRNGLRSDFEAGILKANPSISKEQLATNREQMMKLLCKYKKVNYQKD